MVSLSEFSFFCVVVVGVVVEVLEVLVEVLVVVV